MAERTRFSRAFRPHICVIGAGLAGLRCADVLLRHGFRVSMFEARDRIGGRVCQSYEAGFPLDLGPNWIHGDSPSNPIQELAQKTGAVTCIPEVSEAICVPSGTIMKYAESSAYFSKFWSFVGSAFAYSRFEGSKIPASKSLLDFLRDAVDKDIDFSFQDEIKGKVALDKTLFMKLSELWGSYIGESTGRQSLRYLWMEECIEGDNSFLAGTYASILSAVAEYPLKSAELHLSTPVTHVDSTSSLHHVTIRTELTSYNFDEVVLTTPLGWLKNNFQTAFIPPLPERVCSAITSLGYSRLEKVYLTFQSPFWRLNSSSGNVEDNVIFSSAISFLATDTAPFTTCFDLSRLPKPHATPTLLFYISGDVSSQLTASLASIAEDKDPSAPRAFLERFFLPRLSLLPNFKPDDASCKVVNAVATSWTTDPWAGYGSYSFFPTGLEKGDEDVEVLRSGLGCGLERRLWFAGEAVAPFVALGTTTGALWSGREAARRVAEPYGVVVEKVLIDDE